MQLLVVWENDFILLTITGWDTFVLTLLKRPVIFNQMYQRSQLDIGSFVNFNGGNLIDKESKIRVAGSVFSRLFSGCNELKQLYCRI